MCIRDSSGPTFAFIPTPAMLGGDLSYDTLAKAFNTPADASGSLPGLTTGCNTDYAIAAAYSNIGGDCHSPAGGTDEYGNSIPAVGAANAGQISPASINPAMATFTKFYPAINRTPQPANGYASDGYNWVQNVLATNNGLQLHSSADENFSDSRCV